MPSPTIKFTSLFGALNAHLQTAFPGLHAADHERFTIETPRPAALTEIADLGFTETSGDDGTERLCVILVLSTFVIYTGSGDERENRLACRALALRLTHSLRYKFKDESISQPSVTDIATDYLSSSGDNTQGTNNASLVECQRIDWEVSGYIGADIWEDWTQKAIAEQIVLGDGLPVDEYFPKEETTP